MRSAVIEPRPHALYRMFFLTTGRLQYKTGTRPNRTRPNIPKMTCDIFDQPMPHNDQMTEISRFGYIFL